MPVFLEAKVGNLNDQHSASTLMVSKNIGDFNDSCGSPSMSNLYITPGGSVGLDGALAVGPGKDINGLHWGIDYPAEEDGGHNSAWGSEVE